MAEPLTLKEEYRRIADYLFDLATSTRPEPVEIDLALAGLPQDTLDAMQANRALVEAETETVETDVDIATGLVYNEELGRRIVNQLVEQAKRSFQGREFDLSELRGQIASQLLSLGKVTPEEIALMSEIEGDVTRLVILENDLLRSFPGRPLYAHRLSAAIKAGVATGVITPEQEAFTRVARGGGTPTTQQEQDAVAFLDQLEVNLPTHLRIAHAQAPDTPSSLKANFTSQISSDLDAITAGTGWFPPFGETAAQIQAERAQEGMLELFDFGNEKKGVERLLAQVGRNVSAEALGKVEGRTREQKAARKAADLLIASAQDAQGVLSARVLSGQITPEDAQREIQSFILSQIGEDGAGFDSIVSNLIELGQREEMDDPAKRTAKVNKIVTNLGVDPNNIPAEARKDLENSLLGNPGALDGLTAADVQSLAQEKAQRDFAEEFATKGDKAVEGVLERLGIGDPFDEGFQQHIRDTVVPRLAPKLQEAAERSPLTFDPEALAGTLLGLPGFRQEPEAVLTPTVPPGLQGAPGELGIPPGPPLVPEHLRPSPEDRAFRKFRDQQPSPLIGFGDDPVFLDREQFRQHFDPSRPPTPPDPVLDFINQYQPTAFERGLNRELRARGQRPFEFGPPEPMSMSEEQPRTGLERPSDMPTPPFPTFANTPVVALRQPRFVTDPDVELGQGQFRTLIDPSSIPDFNDLAFSFAGGDTAFQRFLLGEGSPLEQAFGELPGFFEEEATGRETEAERRLLAAWQRNALGLGIGEHREALKEVFINRREPISTEGFFAERLPGFRQSFEQTPGFQEAQEATRQAGIREAEAAEIAAQEAEDDLAADRDAEIAERERVRRQRLRRGRVLVRG